MEQQLTDIEISKIQNICFNNPNKSCAIVQLIINTCGIVNCSSYAKITKKSKRTILYKANKLTGITICKRRYISIMQ